MASWAVAIGATASRAVIDRMKRQPRMAIPPDCGRRGPLDDPDRPFGLFPAIGAGTCHIFCAPRHGPRPCGLSLFRFQTPPQRTSMSAMPQPVTGSQYPDCIEAIRTRLSARESRLFGIAVLVVYVHHLEQLMESAGPLNGGRMLDELRNRLSQVQRP